MSNKFRARKRNSVTEDDIFADKSTKPVPKDCPPAEKNPDLTLVGDIITKPANWDKLLAKKRGRKPDPEPTVSAWPGSSSNSDEDDEADATQGENKTNIVAHGENITPEDFKHAMVQSLEVSKHIDMLHQQVASNEGIEIALRASLETNEKLDTLIDMFTHKLANNTRTPALDRVLVNPATSRVFGVNLPQMSAASDRPASKMTTQSFLDEFYATEKADDDHLWMAETQKLYGADSTLGYGQTADFQVVQSHNNNNHNNSNPLGKSIGDMVKLFHGDLDLSVNDSMEADLADTYDTTDADDTTTPIDSDDSVVEEPSTFAQTIAAMKAQLFDAEESQLNASLENLAALMNEEEAAVEEAVFKSPQPVTAVEIKTVTDPKKFISVPSVAYSLPPSEANTPRVVPSIEEGIASLPASKHASSSSDDEDSEAEAEAAAEVEASESESEPESESESESESEREEDEADAKLTEDVPAATGDVGTRALDLGDIEVDETGWCVPGLASSLPGSEQLSPRKPLGEEGTMSDSEVGYDGLLIIPQVLQSLPVSEKSASDSDSDSSESSSSEEEYDTLGASMRDVQFNDLPEEEKAAHMQKQLMTTATILPPKESLPSTPATSADEASSTEADSDVETVTEPTTTALDEYATLLPLRESMPSSPVTSAAEETTVFTPVKQQQNQQQKIVSDYAHDYILPPSESLPSSPVSDNALASSKLQHADTVMVTVDSEFSESDSSSESDSESGSEAEMHSAPSQSMYILPPSESMPSSPVSDDTQQKHTEEPVSVVQKPVYVLPLAESMPSTPEPDETLGSVKLPSIAEKPLSVKEQGRILAFDSDTSDQEADDRDGTLLAGTRNLSDLQFSHDMKQQEPLQQQQQKQSQLPNTPIAVEVPPTTLAKGSATATAATKTKFTVNIKLKVPSPDATQQRIHTPTVVPVAVLQPSQEQQEVDDMSDSDCTYAASSDDEEHEDGVSLSVALRDISLGLDEAMDRFASNVGSSPPVQQPYVTPQRYDAPSVQQSTPEPEQQQAHEQPTSQHTAQPWGAWKNQYAHKMQALSGRSPKVNSRNNSAVGTASGKTNNSVVSDSYARRQRVRAMMERFQM